MTGNHIKDVKNMDFLSINALYINITSFALAINLSTQMQLKDFGGKINSTYI